MTRLAEGGYGRLAFFHKVRFEKSADDIKSAATVVWGRVAARMIDRENLIKQLGEGCMQLNFDGVLEDAMRSVAREMHGPALGDFWNRIAECLSGPMGGPR